MNGGLIDPMALAGILAEQPDPVGWLDPIAPIYQGTGTFSMTTSDSVIGATSPPGSLAASWSGQVDNRNQLTRVNATAIHSDANGNITDDGERIYYWDAEQRLYGILDKKTNRGTVFIYDGLGRRVREYDADFTRGTLDLAQKADYAWCGSKVCQTRDAWGTTIEMPQGLIREGSPIAYYFHRDHLGSVVDVSRADGNHLARTMYSPYGQKELLSSDAAYVEYAGMRLHEPSGLYLTYYRAYDPKLGRWLSRDPIGEAGGLNLYGYVGCRPGSYTDPWGLAPGYMVKRMSRRPIYKLPIPQLSNDLCSALHKLAAQKDSPWIRGDDLYYSERGEETVFIDAVLGPGNLVIDGVDLQYLLVQHRFVRSTGWAGVPSGLMSELFFQAFYIPLFSTVSVIRADQGLQEWMDDVSGDMRGVSYGFAAGRAPDFQSFVNVNCPCN